MSWAAYEEGGGEVGLSSASALVAEGLGTRRERLPGLICFLKRRGGDEKLRQVRNLRMYFPTSYRSVKAPNFTGPQCLIHVDEGRHTSLSPHK